MHSFNFFKGLSEPSGSVAASLLSPKCFSNETESSSGSSRAVAAAIAEAEAGNPHAALDTKNAQQVTPFRGQRPIAGPTLVQQPSNMQVITIHILSIADLSPVSSLHGPMSCFKKINMFAKKKSLLCVEVCIQNLDFVFGMKTCNIETGTFSIFRMIFFNIGPLGWADMFGSFSDRFRIVNGVSSVFRACVVDRIPL